MCKEQDKTQRGGAIAVKALHGSLPLLFAGGCEEVSRIDVDNDKHFKGKLFRPSKCGFLTLQLDAKPHYLNADLPRIACVRLSLSSRSRS